MQYIFKSNGHYLGFISNGYIYSRDGIYMGWVEGGFAWDKHGQFRGYLSEDGKYILKNVYTIPPVSKSPKPNPSSPVLPTPPANIVPIVLPVGVQDAF